MNHTKTSVSPEMVKRLMWDHREMTVDQVNTILEKGSGEDFYWLVGRMVERLEPQEVTSLINPDQLYSIFPKLRVWSRLTANKAAALFPQKYQLSV